MKFLILLILIVSALSVTIQKEENKKGIHYTLSDPIYYAASPVYYTYNPTSYYYTFDPYSSYYYGSYAYPTTFDYTSYPYYWRKSAEAKEEDDANKKKEKENNSTEFKVENAEKEVKALRKEVFGDENFNTAEIRKQNKVYDLKWIVSQLRISRVLEIEDLLKLFENNSKKKEGSNTKDDAKVEKKEEVKVEKKEEVKMEKKEEKK